MDKVILISAVFVGFIIGFLLRGWLDDMHQKALAEIARYTEAEKLARRNYSMKVWQEELSTGYVYVSQSAEIPNCLGMGRTQTAAIRDLYEGRVDYIAYCIKHNLPVPEPKGKTK